MTSPGNDELLNYGAVRKNDVAPGEMATLIVIGLPRSGTSMVASILVDLGVFMGARIDQAVFEDVELAHALEAGHKEELAQVIASRNVSHKVWGFKRPEAYKRLEHLCASCRNPRIVVPFRDILAISIRNNIAMQLDPMESLPDLVADYRALLSALERVQVPMLLLSYEKALQFPIDTVKEIASFAGVSISPEVAAEVASVIENGNPQYVRAARLHYHGFVGRLSERRLHGWVKVRHLDDIRVAVELELDGKVIQRTTADIYRPDLEQAGFGDGCYGFEFSVTDDMDPNSIVKIRVQNSRIVLQNSGRPLSTYC